MTALEDALREAFGRQTEVPPPVDDLAGVVIGRSRAIRRRQRLTAGGAATLVLLLLAAGGFALRDRPGAGPRPAAEAPSATATATSEAVDLPALRALPDGGGTTLDLLVTATVPGAAPAEVHPAGGSTVRLPDGVDEAKKAAGGWVVHTGGGKTLGGYAHVAADGKVTYLAGSAPPPAAVHVDRTGTRAAFAVQYQDRLEIQVLGLPEGHDLARTTLATGSALDGWFGRLLMLRQSDGRANTWDYTKGSFDSGTGASTAPLRLLGAAGGDEAYAVRGSGGKRCLVTVVPAQAFRESGANCAPGFDLDTIVSVSPDGRTLVALDPGRATLRLAAARALVSGGVAPAEIGLPKGLMYTTWVWDGDDAVIGVLVDPRTRASGLMRCRVSSGSCERVDTSGVPAGASALPIPSSD